MSSSTPVRDVGAPRRQVVHLLCPNYSGSTLLGLLLATLPEVTFVGEPALTLRRNDQGDWRHHRFCSTCDECPVWTPEAIDRIRGHHDPVSEVYSVASTLGGRWMVDASKSEAWTRQVAASDAMDLRIVHLSRRVEASVYSALERERTASRLPATVRAGRYGRHWSARHDDFLALGPELERPVLRVRYEELVVDPMHELGRLADFLGEPAPDVEPGEALHIQPQRHRVKGNPGVKEKLRTGGTITVEPDLRWESELSRSARLTLRAVPRIERTTRRLA